MFAVASKTTVAAPRAAHLIRQTNRRQSAAKCRRNRVATNEVAPSAPAMSNRYARPRASRRRSSPRPPPAPVALNGAPPRLFFPLGARAIAFSASAPLPPARAADARLTPPPSAPSLLSGIPPRR